MLNILLCTGRSAIDDDFNYNITVSTSPPQKKASLNGKRKVTKLQIGAPSDFRHEHHMGYDEVAGVDVDAYQRQFQMQQTRSIPSAISIPGPSSPSSHTQIEPASPPRSPVRRKPVPTTPPMEVEVPASYRTSGSIPRETSFATSPVRVRPHRASSTASSMRSVGTSIPGSSPVTTRKALVPLFSDREAGSNAPYVTQTAKLRWDGAMAEIEKALQENR